ncbi:MAG TPA: exodeoxyribonuclease VII small subunit [bacterium]|nr:exodeoxyribonuclease VII small subunit [bacterium]
MSPVKQADKQEMRFEEAFNKLEAIVNDLEQGEMTLEESMKSFEQGMELIRICRTRLNEAEGAFSRLVKEENGFHLEPLE